MMIFDVREIMTPYDVSCAKEPKSYYAACKTMKEIETLTINLLNIILGPFCCPITMLKTKVYLCCSIIMYKYISCSQVPELKRQKN